MTLEEKALQSIGYDPIRRVFWIDKKFNNYRIECTRYTLESAEEYVKNKFRTVGVLRRSDPNYQSQKIKTL